MAGRQKKATQDAGTQPATETKTTKPAEDEQGNAPVVGPDSFETQEAFDAYIQKRIDNAMAEGGEGNRGALSDVDAAQKRNPLGIMTGDDIKRVQEEAAKKSHAKKDT